MCILLLFDRKTAYELRFSDWSSDVCSSDLLLFQRFLLRTLEGKTREPILRHLVAGTSVAHLLAQVGNLGHRHARLLGHDDEVRLREGLMQTGDQLFFLRSVHESLPINLAGPSQEHPRTEPSGSNEDQRHLHMVRLAWPDSATP